MIMDFLISLEMPQSILSHVYVGVDVCLYHRFDQGRICLQEFLILHDSSIVDDD